MQDIPLFQERESFRVNDYMVSLRKSTFCTSFAALLNIPGNISDEYVILLSSEFSEHASDVIDIAALDVDVIDGSDNVTHLNSSVSVDRTP